MLGLCWHSPKGRSVAGCSSDVDDRFGVHPSTEQVEPVLKGWVPGLDGRLGQVSLSIAL